MGALKRLTRKTKNLAKKAGSKVKSTAKKVGKGTKKAVKTTGRVTKNTTKKVGKGTKKVAKTTGRVTKNTAKKVGKGTKKVAKTTGRVTKNTAKKVGKGTKKVAKTTGRVTKNTAKKVGKGTKKVAKKVGSSAKKVAVKTGGVVKRNVRRALNISDFRLNVHFVIAHSKKDFPDQEVLAWIENRLRIAEELFSMKPRLKFAKMTFSRRKDVPLDKQFIKGFDYQKYMNKNFDNKSKLITKGALVFLVIDQWAVSSKAFKKGEMKNLCGKAFFPHYPGWKKHGIILQKDCDEFVFSHELGHVLGLHHTFSKVGLCTRKYKKGESGKSSTFKVNTMNLMDYRTNLSEQQKNRLGRRFLNDCQQKAAALARRRYMTIGGKTNYLKLKGII